jgi:hypothetical protein
MLTIANIARASLEIVLTRIKVMSTTGDYFRIQAATEGRTIRGYVHREDAFFARAENGKQRKTQNR